MTKTETRTVSQQQENALLEAKEYLIEIGHKKLSLQEFKDAVAETGIRFHDAAVAYVTNYNGSSGVVIKTRPELATKGKLSPDQCRRVLNVLATELDNGTATLAASGLNTVALINDTDDIREAVPGDTEAVTDEPQTPEPVATGKKREKPVVKSTKTMFDLTSVPDGRYAFFDPNERQDWIFLEVKTIKRNTPRSKHFEYGKFIKGRETLKPGTIEVRELRGDTRRLAGYQKPGAGYEGEFIPELIVIADSPAPWSHLYGRMIGHCGICGKRLTDEESRDKTIGPDCFKQWGDEYFEEWDREAMLAEAEAKRAAKEAAKKAEEDAAA